MTWGPGVPSTPTPHSNITVPFFVTNIQEPLLHIRAMLPDPLAANKVLFSTGATAADWTAAPNFTSVPTFLGNPLAYYQSGKVDDSNLLDGINSTQFARVDAATNFTVQPTFLGNSIAYYDGAGLMSIVSLFLSNALTVAGALAASSAAITAGITGATATLTGLCKARTFESTVATGTTPMVVASTTEVANLKAAAATLADTATSANGIADGAVSTTAKLANLVVTAAKIASTTITATQIANATLTDTQVAAANKDGAAGTASLRTLGTGAAQAAAGNHGHTAMSQIDTGSYSGAGGSGSTKTSAIISVIKYVRLIGTNGSAETIWDIISTTPGQNVRVAGAGASVAIGAPTTFTRLNGTNGFIVDSTEGSDTAGYTYNWTAWG